MGKANVLKMIQDLYDLVYPPIDLKGDKIVEYKAMVKALRGLKPGIGTWVCPKCHQRWPVRYCRPCLQKEIDCVNTVWDPR